MIMALVSVMISKLISKACVIDPLASTRSGTSAVITRQRLRHPGCGMIISRIVDSLVDLHDIRIIERRQVVII